MVPDVGGGIFGTLYAFALAFRVPTSPAVFPDYCCIIKIINKESMLQNFVGDSNPQFPLASEVLWHR
jgi:hypothetical protein